MLISGCRSSGGYEEIGDMNKNLVIREVVKKQFNLQ